MKGTFIDAKTGEEEPQCSMNKDAQVAEYHISEVTAKEFRRLLGVKLDKEVSYDSMQQLIDKGRIQGSFLQGLHTTDLRIPKYLRFASLNENYLLYCLDLLDFRAANCQSIICSPTSACNVPVNLISLKKGVLFDNNLEVRQHIRRNASDLGSLVIQIPSLTRSGQWTVGTIDSSQAAENILSGPLVHQLGALGSIVSIARLGLDDVKGPKDTGSMSFPSSVSISSLKNLERQTSSIGNQKCGSKSLNKDLLSIPKAKFTDSDQSSASSSATFCQGMLHRKLDNEIPFYMFTVDGQREVYVAKVLKIESADYKGLDYVYSFYMKNGGRKAQGACDTWLGDLVGRMNVSRSLTLCSNSENSTIMETEFVLFGFDAQQIGSTASSDPVLGKEKLHQNKAVHMFRPKHLLKHRSSLNFKARRSMPDEYPIDPCESNTLDNLGRSEFIGSPSNLELAAIVVKEEIYDNPQETAVGGWGLKFLEKVRVERANSSQEASISSNDIHESCHRDKSDRSARMNVILPAGIHGGPATRNGGPSALTERWRSGGHCDCGGWDIGCPLTVLNNQSGEKASPKASTEGEKSLNLFIEGSKQSVPSLKMVNIHDGDYHIQFQPSLSALQSFSIGMAMIHTRSHSLVSENIQEKQ